MDNNIKVLQGQIDILKELIRKIQVKCDGAAPRQQSMRWPYNNPYDDEVHAYETSIAIIEDMVEELNAQMRNLDQCKLAH